MKIAGEEKKNAVGHVDSRREPRGPLSVGCVVVHSRDGNIPPDLPPGGLIFSSRAARGLPWSDMPPKRLPHMVETTQGPPGARQLRPGRVPCPLWLVFSCMAPPPAESSPAGPVISHGGRNSSGRAAGGVVDHFGCRPQRMPARFCACASLGFGSAQWLARPGWFRRGSWASWPCRAPLFSVVTLHNPPQDSRQVFCACAPQILWAGCVCVLSFLVVPSLAAAY